MENYLKIAESRMEQLIQIYISERKANGEGVIFLNFCNPEKMDCAYIPFVSEKFPIDLRNRILERREKVPSSVIFFNLFDDTNDTLLEVDLDKNSNFYNKQ